MNNIRNLRQQKREAMFALKSWENVNAVGGAGMQTKSLLLVPLKITNSDIQTRQEV